MDIRDRRALKEEADRALTDARNPRKIVAVFIGASIVLSLLMMAADVWLSGQIDNSSGLSAMGHRAIYQTVQTALPIAQYFLVMCWNMGFLSAMLRISRHKYTDERELLSGFHIFGPLLRCTLLQILLYAGLLIACCYIGVILFCMTPLSNASAEILLPYLEDVSALNSAVALDDAAYAALQESLTPAFILIFILYAIVAIPVMYRLRMANYCLLDAPRAGAWAAIRESWRMMKYNRVHLLKLDLSFWGYYLLGLLTTVLCYGDSILSLLGVSLPMSAEAAYYLFYALYLAAYFALNYFLRLKVETTYALAYESLRPKPRQDGVVLGNIFQM